MRKGILISILLLCIATASYLFFQHPSVQTITYFPLDQEGSFTKAKTEINAEKEPDDKTYDVNWTSHSTSNMPAYLRQDVSLLFENGRLKGVASKWKEDTDTIEQEKQLTGASNNYYESVSFHHGEIHDSKEQIKSIQHMSQADLYVINTPGEPIESFSTPKDHVTADWKDKLERSTKLQLRHHWNELMKHFQLNKKDYDLIPLTSLSQYNEKNLPNMTQEETDQVIGKLWEGLYKNYIIPVSSGKNDLSSSFTPIVLVAKDKSHLLVLYQLDGNKKKLIQQL